MLTIQDSQMLELRAQARQRFVDAMCIHLRRKFAARTAGMNDEQLADRVHYGMAEAQRHGVVFKDDIRRYLEYMVIYGAPLDALPALPWLGGILNRSTLSGADKLALIDEHDLASVRAGT